MSSKALSFLSKKSWHTSNLKNQEQVWLKEQDKLVEEKKLKELQAQLEEERELEKLRDLQENAGLLSQTHAAKAKLSWMYQDGAAVVTGSTNTKEAHEPTAEELLMGSFEENNSVDCENGADNQDASATQKNDAAFAGQPFSAVTNTPTIPVLNQNEAFRRMHEDPLFEIRKREIDLREKALSNPFKMQLVVDRVRKLRDNEKINRGHKRDRKSKKKSSSKDEKSGNNEDTHGYHSKRGRRRHSFDSSSSHDLDERRRATKSTRVNPESRKRVSGHESRYRDTLNSKRNLRVESLSSDIDSIREYHHSGKKRDESRSRVRKHHTYCRSKSQNSDRNVRSMHGDALHSHRSSRDESLSSDNSNTKKYERLDKSRGETRTHDRKYREHRRLESRSRSLSSDSRFRKNIDRRNKRDQAEISRMPDEDLHHHRDNEIHSCIPNPKLRNTENHRTVNDTASDGNLCSTVPDETSRNEGKKYGLQANHSSIIENRKDSSLGPSNEMINAALERQANSNKLPTLNNFLKKSTERNEISNSFSVSKYRKMKTSLTTNVKEEKLAEMSIDGKQREKLRIFRAEQDRAEREKSRVEPNGEGEVPEFIRNAQIIQDISLESRIDSKKHTRQRLDSD